MSFKVAVIRTGGTIEKTYDEYSGILSNNVGILDMMISFLEISMEITQIELMSKDSLDMTEKDHKAIAERVLLEQEKYDGIIIVHGTDTLSVTGETIFKQGKLKKAVVLTGAMRPYTLKRTDASQNIIESLMAVQILSPGVFVVMHNKVLEFPGIIKDKKLGTFVKK